MPPKAGWACCAWSLSCLCFPPALLKLCSPSLTQRDVVQAWREKLALVLAIAAVSGLLAFLTFGFSDLVCERVVPMSVADIRENFGVANPRNQFVIVRGRVHDLGWYRSSKFHGPLGKGNVETDATKTAVNSRLGLDVSDLFPPDKENSKCKYWPADDSALFCNPDGRDLRPERYCHLSKKAWDDLRSTWTKTYVGYTWIEINERIAQGERLFVFNGFLYDVDAYFEGKPYFAAKWTNYLKTLSGDATRTIMRNSSFVDEVMPCLFEQYLVGKLDGTTTGCMVTNIIQLFATLILVLIIVIKFISAITFELVLSHQLGKIHEAPPHSNVIALVTAYSEGYEGLRITLDSIARSDYADDQKVIVLICDGIVKGSDNQHDTPTICLEMLTDSKGTSSVSSSPEPLPYVAIGEGNKRFNNAIVHAGFYVSKPREPLKKNAPASDLCNRVVPILLITKTGNASETGKPKAGNRGKRDSQIILMSFLSKVTFNERMSPLEYEIFRKLKLVTTGTWPDAFDMVLMVDADTQVYPDALRRMVHTMELDPLIMGLCGETQISNKWASFTTMIQVYEYFISHKLGKAFESVFGGVTCLPGCFCMYRVKAPKGDGLYTPILANPDIVEEYASSDVRTLHRKNLLLLGEDRYLTTLMLRSFPKRKLVYVPRAICQTHVPDSFRVLLSQRRRWINSTIHNLLELVLVPQLCGIFCCSMQFVIFLELIGTIVLPASFIFLVYLVVKTAISGIMSLPLYFYLATIFLQAVLVLLTAKNVLYLFWLVMYIVGLPIWNFILPVYAFWHFDDFSWGATRKVHGPDTGQATLTRSETAKVSNISHKFWIEWETERRAGSKANNDKRKQMTRTNGPGTVGVQQIFELPMNAQRVLPVRILPFRPTGHQPSSTMVNNVAHSQYQSQPQLLIPPPAPYSFQALPHAPSQQSLSSLSSNAPLLGDSQHRTTGRIPRSFV